MVRISNTPLDRAIEAAGGASALAKAIGVAPSTPIMWRIRGNVPAEYCPAIEKATGITCEDLRPDVGWSVLRGTAVKESADVK